MKVAALVILLLYATTSPEPRAPFISMDSQFVDRCQERLRAFALEGLAIEHMKDREKRLDALRMLVEKVQNLRHHCSKTFDSFHEDD